MLIFDLIEFGHNARTDPPRGCVSFAQCGRSPTKDRPEGGLTVKKLEAWPGAGFSYDLKKINDPIYNDPDTAQRQASILFDQIEEQANKLPDTGARVRYYELAAAEIHFASGMRELDYGDASFTARAVYKKCLSAKELQVLRAKHEADSQQTAGSSDSGAVTTARRVMALYYLVLAANGGETVNQSALGRLLEFMTGQQPPSTKRHWQNPLGAGRKEDQKNRDIVRHLLLDLRLTGAVELMDKDRE